MGSAVALNESHPCSREALESLDLARVDLVPHMAGDHTVQHVRESHAQPPLRLHAVDPRRQPSGRRRAVTLTARFRAKR